MSFGRRAGGSFLRRLSIRTDIILWFSAAMVASSVATYVLVYLISASVMQKTLRGYLTGTVDANTDKLSWYDAALTGREKEEDPDSIFLDWRDGHIRIDGDFLDVMHNVEAGLYESGGNMLYGKNPIPHALSGEPFTSSRIYSVRTEGETWFVYDRKLTGPLNGLWIRGVVPLSTETRALSEVQGIVLLFLPVLLFSAAMLGVLAARRILRPIREIEKTAADISGGNDLKKRLPVKVSPDKGGDELDSLSVTINGMLNRLEKSFEIEHQFSSDASHELRTPVSVIMAQTELALEKDRSPGEYRAALEVVRRQGTRMQTLVTDMLDYTRLQQNPGRYPMEEVDLSALALQLCGDMKMIRHRSISLTEEIEEGLHVRGNVSLLTRLLQNLIDNAYKYGRENGWIKVTLTRAEGGPIHLSVSDNGIGIPADALGHIFQRFYRADASRTRGSRKGYGLGLSIVERIAELHGAEIRVESEEDAGSTFTVEFPGGV